MGVAMGLPAGRRPPPSCLIFLLLKLLATASQGLPGSGPLGFHFTHPVYNATVHENSAARTYVSSPGRMGIALADRSWDVKYRVVSGDEEGFFKAEEVLIADFCFLRIRTKGGNSAILNREVQDHYLLVVKGTVRGEDLEAWTKVSIQVLDMNDLRPLFSPTTYSVTVAESTPLRASVAQVTATDADIGSNGEFYYYFKNRVDLFSVHPTSGVISLSGRLNYDEQARHDLEVLAVDRGMKLYGNNGVSSTARLHVHVERVNAHAPELRVAALAPSPLDTEPTYALVTVEDADEGANGEVESVSIVAGDPLGQFFLARDETGTHEYRVKQRQPVDWASFPLGCNLTVQARDRGSPPRLSAATLLHVPNPHRDAVPVRFEKERYEARVSEFAPPGVAVVVVKLRPEPPGTEYRLSPGEDARSFSINTRSGLIVTAQPLSAAHKDLYQLEVTSRGGALRALVAVTVEDANDHAPEFQQPWYEVAVNESVPVGTGVLAVSASDRDQGENGYITYSIASLGPLPFAINQFTGLVSTTEELDFESCPETYRFVVRASDWGAPYRHEREVNVTVRVRNANDNRPLFERVACQGAIAQDFPVGGHVTAVSAIDVDELELVKYQILSGNELGFFYLNPDSGILQLKKSLVEAGTRNAHFTLRITATDGEHFADPMSVNISVLQGKAPSKSFSCRETRVAQRLAEKLLMKAKAHGRLHQGDGFLDFYAANREGPRFDRSLPSDVAVREDLPVGAAVLRVRASDPDAGFNGKVLFTIADGNTDSCFSIDMDTGQLMVLMPLDRERTDLYLLNITAYDLGTPQRAAWCLLTITVEDVNDNSPVFLQDGYAASVPESAGVGTQLIQVEARDPDQGTNGEVTYSLLTDTRQFAINSSTGIVYVADQLDRESRASYSLKIEARDRADGGRQLSSVATLHVLLDDVNDCAPAFVPRGYRAKVPEDLPVGTVVAWLETHDPDLGPGGQVRYSLVNDEGGRFEVDRASGAVRLRQELDYEKQQFYNLTVRAKDKGRPVSLSSVSFVAVEVVDVNENLHAPRFPDFVVLGSVREDARVGSSVLRVAAHDEDPGRDGELRYSIRDGSGLGRFSIDEDSGVISTAEALDRETAAAYWLTVHAADRGAAPLRASVEVLLELEDVNDNAPLTSAPLYRPAVPENSPRDAPVVQIQAEDPDPSSGGRLTYRIASGNPQNFFAINARTGLISTTSRKLDREQQAEHFLEVTVTDGGPSPKQSTAWVSVRVLDENDNRPQFPEKVYQVRLPERERRRRAEPIYRAFAFDRDEGANAEIAYSIVDGNGDGRFFIDPKTGLVSSRRQFTAGSYDILTIKAVDNGRPQKSSTARLHIEWIKRPPPSPLPLAFEEPFYNFTVMESDRVADIVGVVSAQPAGAPLWFDIVGGKHAREMFSILQTACGQNCSTEGGNSDSAFDVEKGAGTIVIAKPLDAELRSAYNMTVEVTDGTSVAVTQVLIRVLDSNDNGPEFSQPHYDVTISEDALPDTEILRLEASDRDEQHRLSFTVHSSLDPGSMRKFRIDPSSGVLSTAERLDHEAQDRHLLTVMVRDQEFPYRRSLARVTVHVEDANDHSPCFPHTLYEASVFESAAPGSAVLQVTALDRDRGENAELVYSIEAGNTGSTFKIEPVLGIISVAKELDMAAMGQFVLSVRATDRGSPPMSATTIVRVSITMSNNARPRFTPRDYQAEVSENVDVGTSVVLVSATSQSTLVYEVRDGNVGGVFSINPYSGVISTRKGLDFEHTPSYQLTVQATNMAGMAANATVSIQVLDENDNAPGFLSARFSGRLSEAAPVGSVVGGPDGRPLVIRAADADSGRNALLVYQILEPAAREVFAVDASTGAVRTIAPLDHESVARFLFHVHVRDSGSPQLAAESPAEVSVEVVDENDSPPAFTQAAPEAILLLPTYVGVEVLTVSAADPDSEVPSELTYSLAEGGSGHFLMDADSGVLTVSNSSLTKDHYVLTVSVSDGKFSSMATVTVLVKEAMDSGLRFTQSLYSASVPENSTNVTKVAVVTAVGSRLNEPLRYSILNPGNKFRIKPTSGVIQTTGVPLDREERESYELVVEASRELGRLHVARVVVRVSVEDANDNPPVFVGLPYYAAVQVDAMPGTLIYQVTAVDKDKGANGAVTYVLQDDYGHFEINPHSGDVILKEAFDADLSSIEYGVTVLASDGGEPSLSTSVDLPITVVNKAMPVFDRPFYAVSVDEDVGLDTPVLSVNASSPEGQGLVYVLVDGDPLSQFSVGFDTGVLQVVSPLDYEVMPAYRLMVRASDTLTGAKAEVAVDVLVRDVNDNPPVFAQPVYNATLSEAALVGTPVLQLAASDADAAHNRAVHYQIVQASHNGSDHFHVDGASGLILTARALDREALPRCTLRVRAADGGVPPLSSEVLVHVHVADVNDNAPAFDQLVYEAYVSELAPRGHFVTRVQAWDSDSSDAERLEYSILSGNDRAGFLMDTRSGVLSLSGHRKQRMEPLYSLNVSVSDGLFAGTAQVHVRVLGANLHSPAFAQTTQVAEVRENAAPGTKVALVRATDEDPGPFGHLSYAILSDFARDRFLVDGSGQLVTTERLDRENPLEADVSIPLRALDGGGRAAFCAVQVIVLDENDNAPQFTAMEYRASVRADVGSGHLVAQVQATDLDDGANARLTYSLYSEASVSVADLLEIDPDSGWLVTKGSFQQLRSTVLSFFVKAVDGGVPVRHSLVPVYVHVVAPETPLPSFPQPQYSFSLPEDAALGSTLDTLRVLPGHGARFSTVNGELPEHNGGSVFIIEPDTGTLKLDQRLDHEATPAFHFKVAATVPQDTVDVVVTVDVDVRVLDLNDNRPVFDSACYEAVVTEGMPAGTRLAQVRAADPDGGANGQVTYALLADAQPAATLEAFAVDSSTGWISTLKALDHEAGPAFTFAVVAADLGEAFSLSSTASVSVRVTDVNDNPPVFTRELCRGEVKESDPPGQVVAVLSTRDGDSSDANRQVSYHITGGDPRGSFALGLVQGEWKVYVKRPLDREEQGLYLLNVTATDGLFVSQATVEVTVTDVNDNSPVCDQATYTASFPEDIAPDEVVLRVGALDADAGANGEIRFSLHGPGNDEFFLDPETGELKTLAPLDRERVPVYSLVARATDGGGRSCESRLSLHLQDVNDNPPVFSATRYEACVYENTAPKALVARVQAVDPDLGANRSVTYSLADSAGGVFSIDGASGLVILERPLDRELQPSYSVRVQASDQGPGPTLSSLATLAITVLDVNDNPPVFERRDYLAAVPEDTAPGTPVLTVFAASRDIGTNAEITYLVRSGNELGKFGIHPRTGGISVSEALDYESCKKFYLVVEAKDGGTPALSALATVSIELTDVNDNPPAFSQDVYSAVISEDAAVGTSVVLLLAEDADSPPNAQIRFSIAGGDRDDEFAMDPVLGLLRVKKKLDRERVSGYSLLVQAVDSGLPTMSATTTVNIDISDVNDNGPVFTPTNYTAVIQENQPVGTSVVQLVVADRDSFHNGPPFSFAILSGNEQQAFAVDPQGTLRSAVVFRQAQAPEFLLCVQATDSGQPQQASRTYVRVRVIQESVHRPTATPLEVFVVALEDDFPGGVIGQVHATDQDAYDTLTFTLTSEQKSLFKVNSRDGRITALGGLDSGKYVLNVSVSDGRFQVPVGVVVHVEQLAREMLPHTVTLRLEDVSPEDFVGLHLHSFRRALRAAVLTQKQDSLRIASIQPAPGARQLDMLFAVERRPRDFYKPAYLIQKLSGARRHLEGTVRIAAILEKNCSGLDCQEQHCEQALSLDSHALLTYSTARTSFVCPRFHRSARCACNGGLCPGADDPCVEKPCPGDMQCVGYEASPRPFLCQCPPGKLGECSGHSSLSFAGNSYIKYRLSEDSREEAFQLALRLRTLQGSGVVMHTRAGPCLTLKIVDGKLWFQLDCGPGPGILGISGRAVNDGSWHWVSLELNRNFTSLSLDDSYVERRRAPLYFQKLRANTAVYFGAQVQVGGAAEAQAAPLLSGFQGCLDAVVLNGHELPLQNKRSSFAEVVGLTELRLGCVLYPDACARGPCQHGGSCSGLPSGGYQCACLSHFTGRNCEAEVTACFPNPCRNGGSCHAAGGAFTCSCGAGLTGLRCEDDVDECAREECENGGACVNVFGSFACNCTRGFVGPRCALRPVLVPDIRAGQAYVGKEELVGLAAVLLVILVLVALFAAFRRKVFRKHYSRNNIALVRDPAAAALLRKTNGAAFRGLRAGEPPQVPVRPMAYTPCFQSDSRGNLDKAADALGAEHQEMTTFHPESPRILPARRGVVVCSVAPNLPAVSPCRSDCDSIRKGGWDAGPDIHQDRGAEDPGDGTCFSGSNKGSSSEVQSLSSFQSDSGDDNASIVTVIQLVSNVVDTIEDEVSVVDQGQNYNRAYHWDTSDWMPAAHLPDIEEAPHYEGHEGTPAAGAARELDSEYYLGGYDVDSEYPPPPEEDFLSQDQLPPPLPRDGPDQDEALALARPLSPGCRRRPHFHPSQYLPPHPCPHDAPDPTACPFSTFAGSLPRAPEPAAVPSGDPLSLHNPRGAWAPDMSAVSSSCGLDGPGLAVGDGGGGGEPGCHLPFLETQHQTQV